MMKRFRQRVVIENATIAPNEYQDSVKSWSTLATRWAELLPVKSTETYNADQVKNKTTHTFKCYYDDTLFASFTAASRVTWDSRTFELTGNPIIDENNPRKLIMADLVEVV